MDIYLPLTLARHMQLMRFATGSSWRHVRCFPDRWMVNYPPPSHITPDSHASCDVIATIIGMIASIKEATGKLHKPLALHNAIG